MRRLFAMRVLSWLCAVAASFAVCVAPTIVFLDATGGQIAAPKIGAIHEDFYKEYLDEAIAATKKKLSLTPEAARQ